MTTTRRPLTAADLCEALTADQQATAETIEELIAQQTPRKLRLCDYCGDRPAQGYVKAYRSHVCCECYEDHHGPAIDVDPIC